MRYNYQADVAVACRLSDGTKSIVKWGGFRSQLEASGQSSHSEEL